MVKLPKIWQNKAGLLRHLRRAFTVCPWLQSQTLKLREKPAQIFLIATMLAFCWQILTVIGNSTHLSPHCLKCNCTNKLARSAVYGSNHNQLASLTTANQCNFAYLEGKVWRKNLTCNFGISMPILVLINIKNLTQ